MSIKAYKKQKEKLHSKWEKLLTEQMYENAMEEKKAAIEAGHLKLVYLIYQLLLMAARRNVLMAIVILHYQVYVAL